MRLRKKTFFLIPVFLLFPLLAFAFELKNPLKYKTFADLINAIIDLAWTVSLVLAPLLIIIGGFYFISSVGDPSKVETGKKIILYTLIGLLIIMIAKGLIVFMTKVIIPG
jgi:hypothetical protein